MKKLEIMKHGPAGEDRPGPREGRRGTTRRSRPVRAAALGLSLCLVWGGLAACGQGAQKGPEQIVLEEIGLTLLLPEEWAGKYGVEMDADGRGCAIYATAIHDGDGEMAGQGYLCSVEHTEPAVTDMELWEMQPAPHRYIFSTADTTYYMTYISDIQYDVHDPEESELFVSMDQQTHQIEFQIDNPDSVD